MSKVAAYIRTSLEGQGHGLDSQERAVLDYLKGHGLGDAKVYRDEMSAATTKRPGFEKLQRDIFNGKVRTVVTWKLDRLSRSLKDGINLLTDWLDKDVRVVAVAQQLDFSGGVGQLIASVLFALAAMERENLRENTKRGMAAAVARGAKLGKRPKLFAKDITPLLEQGLTLSEVARQLKKSRQACYTALARDGVAIKTS